LDIGTNRYFVHLPENSLAPAALGEDSVLGQAPAKAPSELAPNLTGRLPAPPPSSKVGPTFQRPSSSLQGYVEHADQA